MAARPLGHYVAVSPSHQNEKTYRGTNIIKGIRGHAPGDYLEGTVLAVGSSVEAVKAGDRVVYQKQSGHPGQFKAIDAEMFGGAPGDWAVLIPCYLGSLESAREIDTEIEQRSKSIEYLMDVKDYGSLRRLDKEHFARQSYKIDELKRKRAGLARGKKQTGPIDHTKGRGIVAVVEDK